MKKKLALVTGASSGIGRATAIQLAKDGYYLLVHYGRNEEGAKETLSQIESQGGQGELIGFDVKDFPSVEQALDRQFATTEDRVPAILVNNAGIHKDNMAGLMSAADFDEVISTNLNGAFYVLKPCIRRFIHQRAGCIVNVSSLAGQTGNAGQINYAAAKAGLIAMTKTLAMEIGPRGIRVNAVAPGLIETEMIQKIPHLEEFKNRIPLRRFGTAQEVAKAIAFLCSDSASYITGHTLSINGGLFPS